MSCAPRAVRRRKAVKHARRVQKAQERVSAGPKKAHLRPEFVQASPQCAGGLRCHPAVHPLVLRLVRVLVVLGRVGPLRSARPALALRCARPGVRLRSRSGFLRSRSAALALACARARLRSGASTESCARARLRSEASTGTSSTDLGTGGWAQPAEIITTALHD